MNAERLLEVYEQISEAPDAIARLRRFVLDLAVRGKLVEQDAGDEPASVLMKAAKALQTKEGVKFKADPLQPSETPFQAPLGWLWTRVGVIALQTGSGSTPRGGKSAYADEGTPFLRSQNIYDDGLRLDDVVFISDETNQKMKRTQVKAKDLLLNITGGSIGRCTRIPDEFEGANVSQHVAIIRTAAPGTEDYLHLLVRSPFFQELVVGEQTGAGRGGLPKNRMDRIPVPLPPLAEQHRIVAKVDELMALCDRLEKARKTREKTRDKLTTASLARLTAPETTQTSSGKVGTDFPSGDATTEGDFPTHAAFALEALPALTTRPDQIKTLRQTILNLAVRGKLVKQDPADEPALASLERIASAKQKSRKGRDWAAEHGQNQEMMFPAPQGWEWTLIDRVSHRVTVGHVGSMKDKYVEDGIPFLRSQNVRANRFRQEGLTFISEEFHAKLKKSELHPGDVVVVRSGNVGTACVIPPELTAANCSDLVIIQKPAAVVPEFLCFYLNSLAAVHIEAGTVGVALTHFNTKSVATMPFPLPPFAEQNRIVAKVNALMTLCDRLEAALTTTDTTRTRLLEALLHEALEPAEEAREAAE